MLKFRVHACEVYTTRATRCWAESRARPHRTEDTLAHLATRPRLNAMDDGTRPLLMRAVKSVSAHGRASQRGRQPFQ